MVVPCFIECWELRDYLCCCWFELRTEWPNTIMQMDCLVKCCIDRRAKWRIFDVWCVSYVSVSKCMWFYWICLDTLTKTMKNEKPGMQGTRIEKERYGERERQRNNEKEIIFTCLARLCNNFVHIHWFVYNYSWHTQFVVHFNLLWPKYVLLLLLFFCLPFNWFICIFLGITFQSMSIL